MPLALADVPEQDRILSPRAFRAFQEGRPDRERWELVAGRAVMMAPAFLTHNRIGDTIVRLLNDALEAHDLSRVALQRIGVELGGSDAYRPEPDFAVIDADFEARQRFADRVHLLGEIVSSTIVSSTDDERVPGTGRPWIAIKRDLYLAHAPCRAVLIVEQERIEARLALRAPEGWRFETLTGADTPLALPEFGLSCTLGRLYDGTPLRPRRAP